MGTCAHLSLRARGAPAPLQARLRHFNPCVRPTATGHVRSHGDRLYLPHTDTLPDGPREGSEQHEAPARTPFANPVEGGSANDYEYCSGDPVNCFDTDGTIDPRHMAAWCLTNSPGRCALAWRLGAHARSRSRQLFPDDKIAADVFRHAYWHALMTMSGMPRGWATRFGIEWERFPGNRRDQRVADLDNNARGREVGAAMRRSGSSISTAEEHLYILIRTRSSAFNYEFTLE